MKTAIEEQSEELTRIAEEVQRKVSEVASNTIKKLREFDSDLAAMLTPTFKKAPMWEKAFSFSLTGDNAIPLNKRGSGIRRLVLFSFFRATTESSLFEQKNIIEALNPLFSRVKRSRCRSSQEINDAPTPFSALNYCLPICAKASFSLSKPNIAAYETRNPRTTAATTIYHTTAIALIWQ